NRERLRQAEAAVRGRLELSEGDPVRLLAEAVAREPEHGDGVVVGPDGAGVVPDRVEAGVVWGEGADTPAGEHPVRNELADDEGGAVSGDDSRPEQVPHVRRQRVDLALVAVEPDDVVAAPFVRPEVGVEALVERGRLTLETGCELLVAREPQGKF